MPLPSSENSLALPTSSTIPADGPVLECAPPGADAGHHCLRIRARRVYPISREDLFTIWTRRQGWDAWMRLRARSRSSLAAYRGGAFRLELAEGPTIHVVTGFVTEIQTSELISLEWVHHNALDRASALEVTFRQLGEHTELSLNHRDITSRREASWLMRLWSSALGRLDALTTDSRSRATRRVRDLGSRILLANESDAGTGRARTFAQSAALVFALAVVPMASTSAQPARRPALAADARFAFGLVVPRASSHA